MRCFRTDSMFFCFSYSRRPSSDKQLHG